MSKLTLTSIFIALCIPLSASTVNVDSLKQALKTSDNDLEKSHILFDIFEHYDAIDQTDSMNVYAKLCLNTYNINNRKNVIKMSEIILGQYRKGHASNITPTADSLLTIIKNQDAKLLLLVGLAEANWSSKKKDEFDKYWSQAKTVLESTAEDYSKFYYYNFWGYKNSAEGNIITALQSYELAGTYVDPNSEEYLRNNINTAFTYVSIKEVDKAIDMLNELLPIAKEKKILRPITYIYYYLMDCYFIAEDYHEVINIAHKSIDHQVKNNLKTPEGYSYCMIAHSYLELSKIDTIMEHVESSTDHTYVDNTSTTYLDSAKFYLDKGIDYSIKHNQTKELGDNYYIMSYYYKQNNNSEKSKFYLHKALDQKYFNKADIDKKLADILTKEKNYKIANIHLNKYIDHKLEKESDSRKDLILATNIIEDSYKYKAQAQANLQQAKQEEKRLRNIIALSLIGLLLFALSLIYVQNNRKKLKGLNKEIGQRNKELDIFINKQKETIKYLDNFASVAAHDLKAPIRTASSFANLLSRASGDKLINEEKEYLAYISTSVAQLSGMIDDLLSLSRLDNNLPEEKEVDLNKVVIEIESLLFNLMSRTESKIVVESTLPKVLGHSTLISQLFQNIIKNAIVHNKAGNSTIVKISSEFKKDNMYTIKISDNSGGIPEYIVPTMFDLFSSSDKNTGNGIGLATCKKIVNHYGGEIWVEVEPGVGSNFYFNLLK